MKFFIPKAKDEAEANDVYQAVKKFAQETLGWKITDDRIYSLRYIHNGKEYFARVGDIEGFTNATVIAILKSNTYLVCTRDRGVARGEPILVGTEEVLDIEYFEKQE